MTCVVLQTGYTLVDWPILCYGSAVPHPANRTLDRSSDS